MSKPNSSNQVGLYRAPHLISQQEARVAFLRDMGFSVDFLGTRLEDSRSSLSLSTLTVQAEAFRNALWSLSQKGGKAVYITRLLHAIGRLSKSGVLTPADVNKSDGSLTDAASNEVVDDQSNDLLRNVLSELETLGDAASLPGGYWLPAPLRIVPLRAIRRWVLVGGIPTNQLPVNVRHIIEYSGSGRILTKNPSERNLPLPEQSEEEWCRMPHAPVHIWSQSVLCTPPEQPYEESEDRFEYYAPAIARDRQARDLQFFRWVEKASLLPDGRYLARRKSKFGLTTYTAAVVRGGRMVSTCELDLGQGDLRRLRYGIDHQAGMPVTVEVTRSKGGWSFQLTNEIPRSEHRLFMTLGRLYLLSNKQYYPRRWEFPDGYALQAVRALERLNVRLNGADDLLNQLTE
jgi:hypothetical protein